MKKLTTFLIFLFFISTVFARHKDFPPIRLSDDYLFIEKENDALQINFEVFLPGTIDKSQSCNIIELFFVSAVDSTLTARIGAITYEGKKRVRHREKERKKAGLPSETFLYKEKIKVKKKLTYTRYHTGKTKYEDWMDDGVVVLFKHFYSPKIKQEMVLVQAETYIPVLITYEE